jgi:hypothetical protein
MIKTTTDRKTSKILGMDFDKDDAKKALVAFAEAFPSVKPLVAAGIRFTVTGDIVDLIYPHRQVVMSQRNQETCKNWPWADVCDLVLDGAGGVAFVTATSAREFRMAVDGSVHVDFGHEGSLHAAGHFVYLLEKEGLEVNVPGEFRETLDQAQEQLA